MWPPPLVGNRHPTPDELHRLFQARISRHPRPGGTGAQENEMYPIAAVAEARERLAAGESPEGFVHFLRTPLCGCGCGEGGGGVGLSSALTTITGSEGYTEAYYRLGDLA